KIGPGCSSTGQKCHSSCLGGCEVPNDPTSCYACQKFELNGRCVDKCPNGTFVHLDNRCINETECHNLRPVASTVKKNETSFKAFNGKCHYSCPDGYQEDPINPHKCIICEGYCPVKCKGANKFKGISSIEDALMFEKCNVIEGSLEIQIEKCGKAEEFTKAFGNIREITGYLQIRFSPTFTSLHMFKNLEIIHGEELVNGRYALSVMELENLRQLFKQNITIKNGLINFESNSKLCFNKITEFVKSVGLENHITENDISKYSNGENAICDAPILLQNLNDNSDERIFTLSFTGFNTTNLNHTKLLGYKIYYKKVDKIDPNMEIGDDSNACDRWESKFVNSGYARFENLEINAIYAYYIQTKVIKHPEAKNAVSKLLFHKTPFKTPEMPRLKKYEAIGPNKILLEWDPPIKPNGIITHYTVMWNAKSIGNNGIGHDSFEKDLHSQSSTTSPSLSSKRDSSEIQKCHNIEATENEESQNEGTEFEDSVLNVIYPGQVLRLPRFFP
uniref:Receptor protein-tyrosine kinase n=1 Tax=Panagrolaimus sp. PS1159 TaxID=55785 RepID=A0AC35FC82_9BILA